MSRCTSPDLCEHCRPPARDPRDLLGELRTLAAAQTKPASMNRAERRAARRSRP